MQSDIETLVHKAEEDYLKQSDIELFRQQAASMQKCLETYECLRDREIAIFQPIVEQLVKTYPQENPQLLEKVLKHWLSVLRYCAMAMLLKNPEYLEYRILEWLSDIVKAHQMQSLESTLYELLFSRLSEVLTKEQLSLLQPFLEQARTALLGTLEPSLVGG
ncbi:phycobilisome protein [Pleurocapsales cyanobacterium LEGE 06147]|nr:phycobilisome protein [Pleurocapsales cyanobacterium LEGE 06147]